MAAIVDEAKYTGCGISVDVCPVGAITITDIAEIGPEMCTDCGNCVEECPDDAITSGQ